MAGFEVCNRFVIEFCECVKDKPGITPGLLSPEVAKVWLCLSISRGNLPIAFKNFVLGNVCSFLKFFLAGRQIILNCSFL